VSTNKFTVEANTGNTAINGALSVGGTASLSTSVALSADPAIGTNKFQVNVGTGVTSVKGALAVAGHSYASASATEAEETLQTSTITGTTVIKAASSGTNEFKVGDHTKVDASSGAVTMNGGGLLTGLGGTGKDLVVKDSGDADGFKVTAATGQTEVKGSLDITGAVTMTAADSSMQAATFGDLTVGSNMFQVAASNGATSVKGSMTVAGTMTTGALVLKELDAEPSAGDSCTLGTVAWHATAGVFVCMDATGGATWRRKAWDAS